MNEYEENGRELERTIVELQKDVGSMSPRRMLEIVRNRMDADLCYVMQIRPDGSGVVRPEHLLTRGGWANTHEWKLDTELGCIFDDRLKSGYFVTFFESDFGWMRKKSGS